MILTVSQDSPLTLFGTGGDTFIPLSLLDQILSADFFQKRPNFFWRWKLKSIGLFWHPAKLIESYKKCAYVVLLMSILLAFMAHANEGQVKGE